MNKSLNITKINKFTYPGTHRETIEGKRHYVIGDYKLPSVTTILSATMPEEKKRLKSMKDLYRLEYLT